MSRIKLTDTLMTAIIKMADGNPGAIMAMSEIAKAAPSIDPQHFVPGFGQVVMLDELEIYGSDIYVLFNDKCGRDVRKLLVLLRAVQLGFMSQSLLQALVKDQGRQVQITPEKFKDLDDKVCAHLPQFQRAPQEQSGE